VYLYLFVCGFSSLLQFAVRVPGEIINTYKSIPDITTWSSCDIFSILFLLYMFGIYTESANFARNCIQSRRDLSICY